MMKNVRNLLAALMLILVAAPTYGQLNLIHNSPDPDLATVDIWVRIQVPPIVDETVKLVDDLEYRHATGFLDLEELAGQTIPPIPVDVTVGITPLDATSFDDAIATFDVNINLTEEAFIIVNGVGDPSAGYATNPEGRDISASLTYVPAVVEPDQGEVALKIQHGSTDAPEVAVLAGRNDDLLLERVGFGDITEDFVNVPADQTYITLASADDPSTHLISFAVDLSAFSGTKMFIFASGYLDNSSNPGDANFGLYAAYDDRVVDISQDFERNTVELEENLTPFVLIHNSPDPAAEVVNVSIEYANLPTVPAKSVPMFDFRQIRGIRTQSGEGFQGYMPAKAPVNINIYGNPPDLQNPVKVFENVQLEVSTGYVGFVSGVADPSSGDFDDSVNDNIGLDLHVFDGLRAQADNAGEVDILVYHGCTDAPAVDVVVRDSELKIVDSFSYGEFNGAGYVSVPPGEYSLDIRLPGSDEALATYLADVSDLAGEAIIVYASGFFNLDNNPGGSAAFGLYGATVANGQSFPLDNVTDREVLKTIQASNFTVYPNPANNQLKLGSTVSQPTEAVITFTDLQGRVLDTKETLLQPGVDSANLDISNLPAGMILWQVEGNQLNATGKLMIQR